MVIGRELSLKEEVKRGSLSSSTYFTSLRCNLLTYLPYLPYLLGGILTQRFAKYVDSSHAFVPSKGSLGVGTCDLIPESHPVLPFAGPSEHFTVSAIPSYAADGTPMRFPFSYAASRELNSKVVRDTADLLSTG